MDTAITTLDTSADSLKAFGIKRLSKQQQAIHDVVSQAARHGVVDMSLNEIRDRYEATHGQRIDVGRVSARVSELVAAGRLVRATIHRDCLVTKHKCLPVSVPAKQAPLFN